MPLVVRLTGTILLQEHPMNTPAPRPPIAHTHRGKPRPFTLEGHHAATKPDRTPTHRKPGAPIVPEHMGWFYRGKTSA